MIIKAISHEDNMRRVVVTGMGVLSPIGNDLSTTWNNLIAGKSGAATIPVLQELGLRTTFAALVKDLDPSYYLDAKELKRNDPFIHYGIIAGIQALADAGIDHNHQLDPSRLGVIFGSGIGGLETIEANHTILQTKGGDRISPFFIPATIINMIAGNLSIKFNLQGPNLAIATACTTGTHCIGMAARLIKYGDADIVLAGGAEKSSSALGIGGFAAARALSKRNEEPAKASRPWDVGRDGFVLGDGAGAMVLEEYEHAKKRGAKIYAELQGFGMSADAFHITSPGNNGAARAMQIALDDAKLNSSQVDYINAHGTSTPKGDLEEIMSIRKVLGEHIRKTAINSTKSMTGHLLGAAGAIEAVFSVMSIKTGIIAPTINLEQVDPECQDLNLVANFAQERAVRVVVSNSFGFGGTNGCLVFSVCQ